MTSCGGRVGGQVVIRLAAALVLTSTVLPLTACRGSTSCRGLAYDIAASARGAVTARAALDAFLASGDSRGFPTDGWVGPSAAGVFTSGSASVMVTRATGSDSWFVTDATTC